MPLISARQIIGKTLIAKKALKGYSLPDLSSKVLYNFSPGGRVGTVYSYIEKGSLLFWMFYNKNQAYYVLHTPDSFSFSALEEQGTKTVEEQRKEKEDEGKDWTEKLGDKAISVVKWGVGLAIGVYVIKEGFSYLSKRQSA